MSKFAWSVDGSAVEFVLDPLVMRPQRLKQGRVVDLAQAFDSALPIQIGNLDSVIPLMAEIAEHPLVLWLILGADRAAPNYGVAR